MGISSVGIIKLSVFSFSSVCLADIGRPWDFGPAKVARILILPCFCAGVIQSLFRAVSYWLIKLGFIQTRACTSWCLSLNDPNLGDLFFVFNSYHLLRSYSLFFFLHLLSTTFSLSLVQPLNDTNLSDWLQLSSSSLITIIFLIPSLLFLFLFVLSSGSSLLLKPHCHHQDM